MADSEWKNKLYFGDNLDILRDHIANESVDLVYLDPPFNSKATYNVLFAEKNGTQSAAQITAFEDTWHWDMKAEATFHEIVTDGPRKLADLIQALRSFLGQNDMMAYLVMMAARLQELQRVLKTTGSIYLHCDSTASHYLKLLMDAIFQPPNFRNEIIWKRTSSHNDAKHFGQVTDTILCYSKASERTWNPILVEHDETYEDGFYRFEDDEGRYRLHEIIRTASMGPRPNLVYEYKGYTPEWGWRMERPKLEALDARNELVWSRTGRPYRKTYLPPGRLPTNLWTDIGNVSAQARERLGYPTQKPEALLERILLSCSNEGDLVLDPFCGCGTTITVAERLRRRWIGIDITHIAITLMRHRLEDAYGPALSPYEVIGDPQDLESARALARESEHEGRYQFQWWAFGKVAARPANDKKKGPDAGVDGVIRFFDDNSGKAKTILVQVKSGGVKRGDIATLKGDMDREKAVIGAFITLEEATGPMRKDAASAGFYEPEHFPGTRYPRVQILTVEDLLNGKRIEYPRLAPEGTFKKAERKRKTRDGEQAQLL